MTTRTPLPQSTAVQTEGRTLQRLLGGIGILAAMGVGIGAAMAGYALLHEPLNIELERLTIRLSNAAGRIPAQGLRILHLSDTHFQGQN